MTEVRVTRDAADTAITVESSPHLHSGTEVNTSVFSWRWNNDFAYQGFAVRKGVGVIIAEKVDLVMLIRAIHCNG